jgi:hypothetical protein
MIIRNDIWLKANSWKLLKIKNSSQAYLASYDSLSNRWVITEQYNSLNHAGLNGLADEFGLMLSNSGIEYDVKYVIDKNGDHWIFTRRRA